MAPDQHFITIKGNRPELGLFVFPQPRMEPFSQRQLVGRHKCALLLVPERLGQLIGYLLTGLPIERGRRGFPVAGSRPMVTCAIQRPSGRRVMASISRRW